MYNFTATIDLGDEIFIIKKQDDKISGSCYSAYGPVSHNLSYEECLDLLEMLSKT